MRALAGIAVVAILVVGGLIALWMVLRPQSTRAARRERDELRHAISQIRAELTTQTVAGYFEPAPIQQILADLDRSRKESSL